MLKKVWCATLCALACALAPTVALAQEDLPQVEAPEAVVQQAGEEQAAYAEPDIAAPGVVEQEAVPSEPIEPSLPAVDVSEEVAPDVTEPIQDASESSDVAQIDPAIQEAEPEATSADTSTDSPVQEATPQDTEQAVDSSVDQPVQASDPAADEDMSQADSPALENGAVYTVSTLKTPKNNMGMDSSKNVANFTAIETLGQYWKAVANTDGTYTFRNLSGDLALSVSGATSKGANVVAASGAGTRWVLTAYDDGKSYRISPAQALGLCLDIYGGSTANGANIRLYAINNTAAQRFTFALQQVLTEAAKNVGKVFDTGVVRIATAANDKMVVDVKGGSKDNSANVQVYESNDTFAQKWQLEYIGNGLYTIRSVNSGKVLDVQGGSKAAGANVQQYRSNGSLAQSWFFVKIGSDYQIVCANGKVLGLSQATPSNGTNVLMANRTGASSQLFSISETDVLSEGVYTFSAACAPKLLVGVANNSKALSAAVQTVANNGNVGNYWYIKPASDGTVRIANLYSPYRVNASATKGSSAKMESSGTKWVVRVNSDGTFTLCHATNTSMVLDVAGGSNKAGAALKAYASNGTNAQKFTFTLNTLLTNAQKNGAPVDEGIYTIKSSVDTNQVLDIAGGSKANHANVQLWRSNGSFAQIYELEYRGDGLYAIQVANSGKYLTAAGNGTKKGTNVEVANGSAKLSQLWVLAKDGSGYVIRNAYSGLALDAAGGKTANKTNMQLYTMNGTAAQRYKIDETQLLKNGTYMFATDLSSGSYVLEVAGGSTSAAANVRIYSNNTTAAQKWKITYEGNGLYTIKNAKSGLVLAVQGASTDKGGNINQQSASNSAAKRWRLEVSEYGGIIFVNEKSDLVLDVQNGKVADTTNVQQWTDNGSKSQSWRLATDADSYLQRVKKFVDRMVYYCRDVSVGYDQSNRWDVRPGGECDCSSLVITCLKEAGFITQSMIDNYEITYTGNMSSTLTQRGWTRLPANLSNVRVGDILLNDANHVCVVVEGSGTTAKVAQASIDENHNIAGGRAGDQKQGGSYTLAEGETNIKTVYWYSSGGWNCILRYTGK